MSDVENISAYISPLVKTGDKVWFISDDELTAGMSFTGVVNNIYAVDVEIMVDGAMGGTWHIPVKWFSENKAFTSELNFVESCANSWFDRTLELKEENKKLNKIIAELVNDRNFLQQNILELEYKHGERTR